MANDLTPSGNRNALTTSARWQEPSLSEKLAALVLSTDALPDRLPALTGDDLVEAQQALSIYRAAPLTSSPRAVDRVMAKLVVAYPAAKLSSAEATARLDLYAEQLGDIPADVLMAGAMAAARTMKFFPSISELREAAMSQPATPRMRRQWRLSQLVEASRESADGKRQSEPGAVEAITPDQIRAMTPQFRTMGLKAGFITQDQIDEALGEQRLAA